MLLATVALARGQGCSVEPFQGAASPQGAIARMRVANTAAGCAITVFGNPGDRDTAAESGRITRQPAHGTAQFVAPRATYTPVRGYVGTDSFAFEAVARGRGVSQVVLKVQVEVEVVQPGQPE
jgi:hypothetical protein